MSKLLPALGASVQDIWSSPAVHQKLFGNILAGVSIFELISSLCLQDIDSCAISLDMEGVRGDYVFIGRKAVSSMCGGCHAVFIERSLFNPPNQPLVQGRVLAGFFGTESSFTKGLGLLQIIDPDKRRLSAINTALKGSRMNNSPVEGSEYRISYDGCVSKAVYEDVHPNLVGVFACEWLPAHGDDLVTSECLNCYHLNYHQRGSTPRCSECGEDRFCEEERLERCVRDNDYMPDSTVNSLLRHKSADRIDMSEYFECLYDICGADKIHAQLAATLCNYGSGSGRIISGRLPNSVYNSLNAHKYTYDIPLRSVLGLLGVDPSKCILDKLLVQAARHNQLTHFPLFITSYAMQTTDTITFIKDLCTLPEEVFHERGLALVAPSRMGTNESEGHHYIYGVAVVISNVRRFLKFYRGIAKFPIHTVLLQE